MSTDKAQGKTIASAGVSRRTFLGAGAAGGAALIAGGAAWPTPADASSADSATAALGPLAGASILDLQRMMAARTLTSRALTRFYLRRIEALNPTLHAVIEINPDAMAIAARLDLERAFGYARGPLHGIPILVKDNIATDDRMETTAGSLALAGSKVRRDARVIARLREAGAVILGKANLSEWANFRGFSPIDETESFFLNGWSGRGGFTRNPYQLGWDPSGSSSGSAVAAAASLCAAAVGTETDGSIVGPANNNLIVGLKPTVGLVSQKGIVPIAHSQDTAGPMGRSVSDVALLLGAMQSPFGEVARHRLPQNYLEHLSRYALRGARIGVDPFVFYAYTDPLQATVVEQALDVMRALGATIVDDISIGDPASFFDAEFTVLLYEFKADVERYLRGLRRTSMRTVGDLIQFNLDHCVEEMTYFGQELFEIAESTGGDLNDPTYLAARELCLRMTRDEGLDRAFRRHRLDAIVAPTIGWSSSHPAVSGYPSLSLPVGFDASDRPVGLLLMGRFLQEARLLGLAYDLEQEINVWTPPALAGSPYEWMDAGLCAAPGATARAEARSLSGASLAVGVRRLPRY